MALSEIRTFREGTFRWCKASGKGLTWQTATNPKSGNVGYVQAGLSFTQTNNYATVMQRGLPDHHKYMGYEPIELSITPLFGITADYPQFIGTASGATTPLIHGEFRASAPEWHLNSAMFFQFHRGVVISEGFTEGEEGDEYAFTIRFLSAIGPTGSGYLS